MYICKKKYIIKYASFYLFYFIYLNVNNQNRSFCACYLTILFAFYPLIRTQSNAGQRMGSVPISAGVAPENALDALLDELQTFSQPTIGMHEVRHFIIIILCCFVKTKFQILVFVVVVYCSHDPTIQHQPMTVRKI